MATYVSTYSGHYNTADHRELAGYFQCYIVVDHVPTYSGRYNTANHRELAGYFQSYICSLAVSPFGMYCTSAVREIGLQHALDAGELCNEWVAFSKQHNDCDMDTESLDRWENQVSYVWLLFCDNSHPPLCSLVFTLLFAFMILH